MISIYLVKQGFDERQTALMLSVFGLGGLLSQLPLGWISDRHGLTRATKISAWIGAAGILLVLFDNHVLIWTGVGLLGVLSACGLTLSVIAATEHSARHSTNIVVAVARVSIVFSLGSAAGPAAAGVCMDYFGPLALPLLTALSCVALYRIN
jgi:predicted MFS family arabinose efflux permease